MKKLSIAVVLLLCISILFVACDNTKNNPSAKTPAGSVSASPSMASPDASNSSESSDDSAASVKPTPAPTDASSGTLGDYEVKILDCKTAKDYKGKAAVIVNFQFTNKSEKNASFMISIMPKVFQNGVQLENAILTKTTKELDNAMKEIKSGVTLACAEAYVLDDKSPITVEASELISFDDTKLTKTFNIK